MKNVFFNEDILQAEKDIISSLGIPPLVLMENAGKNSAEYIIDHFADEISNGIVIIAGKGNNAGDGFVAARHLSIKNINVKVLLLYPEEDIKGDALVNFNALKNSSSEFLTIKSVKSSKDIISGIGTSKIIIDAIFGVGFKGEFDERLEKIIPGLNSLKDKKIISLDSTSGLYDYNSENLKIMADITLTMGVKKFHSLFYNGKKASGRSEVMDIGIPDSEFTKRNKRKIFEPEVSDIKKYFPNRSVTSYKYSNGKVMVIGASVGLTGAAYLSSLAALKTGSGAVLAAVPESLYNVMEVKLTEGIILPVNETEEKSLALSGYNVIKKKIGWADLVLLGPGFSRNSESAELARKIVSENENKFIIDADGIAAFKDHLDLIKSKRGKIILTPHLGEFSNLTGMNVPELIRNFYDISMAFAKKYNCVLVLKNAPSIITDGESFYINPTGRENLATVGTGDVLAGIISGIYSNSDDPLQSAIAGTFLHGMCGDILYERSGASSTIAGELIEQISHAKNMLMGFHHSNNIIDPIAYPFKESDC